MFSHTHKLTVISGTDSVSATTDIITADTELGYDDTIVNADTFVEIVLPVTVADIKSMIIVASKAMTLKTNANDGSADQTISLAANRAVAWKNTDVNACPLDTDVTSFFVKNFSGADGTLKVRILVDGTP